MTIEHTRLDSFGWSKQESAIGLSFATPATFTADGAGSASTTVCSGLPAWGATDDDFVGLILEAVRVAAGPTGEYGGGSRARITGYDHLTGTLTHEAFPWATASGDTFRLLHPPHGWWSDDTGGSATHIKDADRDEADDYWQGSAQEGGPYTLVRAASGIGATVQVLATDFAQALGDLTVASMTDPTVVGDLVDLLQYPEVTGGPVAFEQPRLAREPIVGSMGRVRGVAAPVTISGQQEALFAGPGSGRVGEKSAVNTPLESVLLATAKAATGTVDAGSAVDSIPLSAGAGVVGACYLSAEGDAFLDYSGTDPITPSPSLRTAPATGSSIQGLRVYTPPDTSDPPWACYIEQTYGRGVWESLWGCRPAITLTAERGAFTRFGLAWQGVTGYRRHLDSAGAEYARATVSKLPTVTPRAVDHVRVVLDGVELEARSVTADLGLELQPRINEAAPDLVECIDVRASDPTITVDIFLDSDAKAALRKYREGRACRLAVQIGRTGGEPGVIFLWVHEVEIVSAPIGDDSNARTVQLQLAARHDPLRPASLPRWLLAIG